MKQLPTYVHANQSCNFSFQLSHGARVCYCDGAGFFVSGNAVLYLKLHGIGNSTHVSDKLQTVNANTYIRFFTYLHKYVG